MRSYSRDGERWWQTCRRVIEGMFTVQRIHCLERRLPWDAQRAAWMAEDAYARMFRLQWTPPGRGLWIMGTRFMYEEGGAALNNCGFVSTRNLDRDFRETFRWMFQMLMLGVGVGFDTRGAGKVRIRAPQITPEVYVIDDSREGWGGALDRLLAAYVGETSLPAAWDTHRIRPQGTKLKRFGGYASGPEPLRELLEGLRHLFDRYVGQFVDSTCIVCRPSTQHGYEQPPYETISEEDFERRLATLKPIRGALPHEHQLEVRFCDADECETQPAEE